MTPLENTVSAVLIKQAKRTLPFTIHPPYNIVAFEEKVGSIPQSLVGEIPSVVEDNQLSLI